MDAEKLKEIRQNMVVQMDNHLAAYNQAMGAVQVLDHLLSLQPTEPADSEPTND